MLLALTAFDRGGHAGAKMVAHQFATHPTQRILNRRDLRQHLTAIAVFFDHALHAANLALNDLEAFLNLGSGCVIHPYTIPPWGISASWSATQPAPLRVASRLTIPRLLRPMTDAADTQRETILIDDTLVGTCLTSRTYADGTVHYDSVRFAQDLSLDRNGGNPPCIVDLFCYPDRRCKVTAFHLPGQPVYFDGMLDLFLAFFAPRREPVEQLS